MIDYGGTIAFIQRTGSEIVEAVDCARCVLMPFLATNCRDARDLGLFLGYCYNVSFRDNHMIVKKARNLNFLEHAHCGLMEYLRVRVHCADRQKGHV